VGQHAFRGQVWEKAVLYLKQAGDKALARSAIQEAVGYFDQALSALRQLPRTPDNLAQEIDLRLELRNALHPLGEHDRVYEILREAQALAESADDNRRLARVFSLLAQSLRLKGEYEQALQVGTEAVRIGSQLGDLSIQATANFHLGQTYFQLAAHDDAHRMHGNNVTMLQGNLAQQRLGMAGLPGVFSRGHMAWSLAEVGRFPEALSACDEALQIAGIVKHGYSQAFAEYCGGVVYLRLGEPARAVARLEQGFALCKAMNFRLDIPFVSAFLGYAYALTGRCEDALVLLKQGVDAAASLKMMANRAWLLGLLSEGRLIAGQPGAAVEAADEALEFARQYREAGWEAWALFHKGEALGQRSERSAEATALLEQARARAHALGMRPLAARCDLSLAKLHVGAGDQARSRQHVEAARKALREMGMQRWLQEAESELQAANG
jgi:tetratricopeptide (TPR) repeat protein